MMTRRLLVIALAGLLPLAGCDDDSNDDGNKDMSANRDMAMSGNPAAPRLGAQIDRMGRPAVNTALTNPFDLVAGSSTDAVKDAYNAAGPGGWAAFQPNIRTNLAVLDGADRVCGNSTGAMDDAGNRYDFLATVLADDELQVDTANANCDLYLGVEAAALGVSAASIYCGGRTLTADVIDESYTLLTAGTSAFLGNMHAVTDGIDAGDHAPSATFPFLAAPN
jgi:hypothetical protein